MNPVERFFGTDSLHLGGPRLIEFAKEHPQHLRTLLTRFLETSSENDIYLTDAVSLLPSEQVLEIAATAVRLIEERAGWSSAYQVIQSASAQFPEAFALWRKAILDSVPLRKVDEPSSKSIVLHFQLGPIWRHSPPELLDQIEKVVRDPSLSAGTRRTFVGLIFGSQDWDRIAEMTLDVPVEHDRPLYDPDSECLDNGFELAANGARFLHGHNGYHLQFPVGYLPDWMPLHHPTHKLPTADSPHGFGGRSDVICPNCNRPFARLLTIDPLVPNVGVTNVNRLELIACLQCRFGTQFVQYSVDGQAVTFEVEGETLDFPPVYFARTDVGLAPTPGRWVYPGTGVCENRYRLNGPPDWWQAAEFPVCRSCGRRMPLLLEIPSGGRTEDGSDFMWGDGGAGYVYWCDGCRMSCLLGQCS